jgi:hypothetical protein
MERKPGMTRTMVVTADAHALLASALKGFSPTPEFPEIAEAQTLLTALTS